MLQGSTKGNRLNPCRVVLGGRVDRRGGAESRSDLPDLKSSKVDLKVDFLTKVE